VEGDIGGDEFGNRARSQGAPALLEQDFALRLGLGPWLLDSPRNRAIMQKVGIDPETTSLLVRRLRSRNQWRPVLEELAELHCNGPVPAVAVGAGLGVAAGGSEVGVG